jgi:hypothetical protein
MMLTAIYDDRASSALFIRFSKLGSPA